ncbi:MAG: flagellar assembly protein FlgT [Methylococcaceae bacterium]|nr:flagellar assembly protein FlgT [Methylococcaceae bacterium]
MNEKSDSKCLSLATVSILGQLPSLSICSSSALWKQLRRLLCAYCHALKTNKNPVPVAELIPCTFLKIFLFSSLFFIQGCAKPTAEISKDVEVAAVNHTITVQGQASIKNGAKLLARKQAFRDAIRNASIEAAGKISSETLLGSTKVVDEWISDDIYHLQVLTVVSEGQICNSPYRKRIVATGFPIATSGQVSANETQDLYSGIPREIMNILMESGDFIGRNETHTVIYSRPDMAPEILDPTGYQDSVVIQLAQQYGAQFVLSGVIRDLEVESTEYVRGAGFLAQMKSMMRDFIARRGVAIDIYVHDGLSGALLFQHRYTDTVIGDVWVPVGYSVGSERFKATPTGHKISKIIQLASKDIRQLFACYPFSAKVIKVENKKVYINAGAQDKLKQGDSLVVYATHSNMGMQEKRLIGVVNIRDVQANFSVGEMEIISDARKIKAGDLIKSW